MEPPLGDLDRPGRIEKAVEQEIRRRKILILVYAVLLIIPIGVGAVYLKTGVTDREIVSKQVEPIRQTLSQVEPALAQVRTANTQLSQQRAKIELLGQKVAAIEPVSSSVMDLNSRVSSINEDLRRQQSAFDAIQQNVSTVAARDAEVHRQLADIATTQQQVSRRQDVLERDVHTLSQRVITAPPTNFNQLLEQQNQVIRQLQSDVRRLQQNPVRERELRTRPVTPP